LQAQFCRSRKIFFDDVSTAMVKTQLARSFRRSRFRNASTFVVCLRRGDVATQAIGMTVTEIDSRAAFGRGNARRCQAAAKDVERRSPVGKTGPSPRIGAAEGPPRDQ